MKHANNVLRICFKYIRYLYYKFKKFVVNSNKIEIFSNVFLWRGLLVLNIMVKQTFFNVVKVPIFKAIYKKSHIIKKKNYISPKHILFSSFNHTKKIWVYM